MAESLLTTDITSIQATIPSGYDPLNPIPSSPASASSFPTATAAPPALTVSGSNNYTGTAPAIVAPNLAISGTDTFNGAKVFIDQNFNASKDRLAVGNSTSDNGTDSGIDWKYDSTTGVLTLSNNAANSNVAPATYQDVLRKVTYTNNNSNDPGNARTIQFSLGNLLGNPDNKHFYQFVENSGVKWTDANTATAGFNYFGLKGYLATITSATEQQFIDGKIQGNGWIGASDAEKEGDWKWVTGPESGQSFWSGGVDGNPVNGSYTNWNDGKGGEPNNSGTGENYGHVIGEPTIFRADGTTPALGKWNDLAEVRPVDEYTPKGYIIEYGGSAGDPALNITGSVTVNLSASTQGSPLTTPDFNKDGKPDLLWRNKGTGEDSVWVVNYDNSSADTGFKLDPKTINAPFILPIQDQNWKIVGQYDVNKDGISDIFWRNYGTGENAIWIMKDDANGINYDPVATNFITQVKDPNWEVEGVGDFDNDGSANILWRNYKSGENAIWAVNYDANATGNRFSLDNNKTKFITQITDTNWQMNGWADFNKDGIKDILWRNNKTGENAIWKLNTTASGTTPYFNPATDGYFITKVAPTQNGWAMESATDFNKDGVADILWRNDATGENAIWIMKSGGDLDAAKTDFILPIDPKLGWEIEGTADYTGDQTPDIVWRNYKTGENAIWRMKVDSTTGKAGLDKGFFITKVDDKNWEIKGPRANNDHFS
jgi:FG-GAP-like repeat/Lectin C-type domain